MLRIFRTTSGTPLESHVISLSCCSQLADISALINSN
jgi:hypothetical protein